MEKPTLLICDFDGTLFDSNIAIATAPFFNVRTFRLLKKHDIKFALTTGRPLWTFFSDLQLRLLGITKPNVVIAVSGAVILWQDEKGKFVKDTQWDKTMRKGWDKKEIENHITPFLQKRNLHIAPTYHDLMIRVWMYEKSVAELEEYVAEFQKILKGRAKVIPAEQLLFPNYDDIFSGYILIVPESAGKENSTRYVISRLEEKYQIKQRCILAGDAAVDVAMLTSNFGDSFIFHPTPLAKKMLESPAGAHVKVMEGSGPKLLLDVVKKHVGNSSLTPSQNNPLRLVLRPLEALADRFVDQKLTPDEISLLGFEKTKKALELLENKKTRLPGFFLYLQGAFLDYFDGVRARRRPEAKTPQGQLTDVYCDRLKEFIQLVRTAKNPFWYKAAVSCILPSIAKAQAEILTIIVPEYDKGGGTALSRNIKLSFLTLAEALELSGRAQQTVRRIYETNLQTYYNRRAYFKNFSWEKLQKTDMQSLSDLQRKAVERLLLLVGILQEEYAYLRSLSDIDRETKKQIKELAGGFLSVDVKKIRKSLDIKGYSFPSVKEHLV